MAKSGVTSLNAPEMAQRPLSEVRDPSQQRPSCELRKAMGTGRPIKLVPLIDLKSPKRTRRLQQGDFRSAVLAPLPSRNFQGITQGQETGNCASTVRKAGLAFLD